MKAKEPGVAISNQSHPLLTRYRELCRDAECDINEYIESLDINDDTSHPLWPLVLRLREAAYEWVKKAGA